MNNSKFLIGILFFVFTFAVFLPTRVIADTPWLSLNLDVSKSSPGRGEVFSYTISATNDETQGLSYGLVSEFNDLVIPYRAYTNYSGTCTIDEQLVTCGISHGRRKDAQITIEAFVQTGTAPGTEIITRFDATELYGRTASSNEVSISVGSASFEPPQMPTDSLLVNSLCNDGSISTAIGCLPILEGGVVGLVSVVLLIGAGLGGGIALILIVVAGYMIMNSSGDPRKLQGGKELVFAAISGILMLIFSVFILRLIASDLLQIF